MSVNILLADDHKMIREGLKQLLEIDVYKRQELSDKQLEQLDKYYEILVEWKDVYKRQVQHLHI